MYGGEEALLVLKPFRHCVEAQDSKRKILDHVARYIDFDFSQSGLINFLFIQCVGSLARQIDFPLGKKRVTCSRKQAASYVFPENASILIMRVKVLANSECEMPCPRWVPMRTMRSPP
jgi:hypothetical protein